MILCYWAGFIFSYHNWSYIRFVKTFATLRRTLRSSYKVFCLNIKFWFHLTLSVHLSGCLCNLCCRNEISASNRMKHKTSDAPADKLLQKAGHVSVVMRRQNKSRKVNIIEYQNFIFVYLVFFKATSNVYKGFGHSRIQYFYLFFARSFFEFLRLQKLRMKIKNLCMCWSCMHYGEMR